MILPTDTLIMPFLRQVQSNPNFPALWLEGRFYTYIELHLMAAKIAAYLQVAVATQCIIFSGRNLVAYTGILGALLADKVYLPLNPQMPVARNLLILQQAEVGSVVLDEAAFSQAEILLRACEKPLVVLFPQHVELPDWVNKIKQHRYINKVEIAASVPLPGVAGKNPYAYLLFTSGSTGSPKGVMVKHSNILSYLTSMINRCQPNCRDRFSQITELTFDPSIHDMFVCWSVGACLYVISEKYFINLPKFICDHALTFWASTPSMIALLQRLIKSSVTISFPSLRYSIFGGEPLSHRVATIWHKLAPNSIIENHYGPTEVTIGFTAYRWRAITDNVSGVVSIGKSFSGQKIAIVDKQLRRIARGNIGELCVSGSQVVNGYWKNDKLTRECFVKLPNDLSVDEVWYRTGDLVYLDENEDLIYKGRCDDQMQIRGCRVEKLEIENALRMAAETETVAIIPWPVSLDGVVQSISAFVSNSRKAIAEIRKECRHLLPHYLVPSEIMALEKLPFNSHGKVDYKKLIQIRELLENNNKEKQEHVVY